MRKKTIQDTGGSLRISMDVLHSIVESAVLEVNGVADITYPSQDFLGAKMSRFLESGPVVIRVQDGLATVVVSVILKDSARVQEVAEAIQRSVKSAVQNMTGITVTQVDVIVDGVEFEKEE